MGTTDSRVTRWRSIIRSAPSASKAPSASRPFRTIGLRAKSDRTTIMRPPTCAVGRLSSQRSPSCHPKTAVCTSDEARNAAWLRTAPRGRPVLPDVKTTTAPPLPIGLRFAARPRSGVSAPSPSITSEAPVIASARSLSALVQRG